MRHLSWRKTMACAAATAAVLGGLAGASSAAQAAAAIPARPCNIYAAAGTRCVAAYSTVRSLYRGYHGRLYQVTRASDGATANIGVLRLSGYADAAAQNKFCAGTVCTITRIYDQSPNHNDLGVGPIGGNGTPDNPAIANALPVTVGGHQVYGIDIQAGDGYRNDVTRGVPVGSEAQGAYMVTSAINTNNGCCFDFGNAETSGTDNGNGHMDAINFSTAAGYGTNPNSSGPWVQADLENGLFSSDGSATGNNNGNSSTFVTAIVNNDGTANYEVEDGNAQSGGLTTEYNGPLPDLGGYTPMHQEGAVILGTGGDNSNQSTGYFFEGVLTAGYPSAATDNAIQANIVAADYQQASG